MMKQLYIALLTVFFFSLMKAYAQDISIKQDSVAFKTDLRWSFPHSSDSSSSMELPIKLPRLNPMEKLMPQFTPFQKYTLTPQPTSKSNIPPIHWDGVASDFINAKSRTVIASMIPSSKLMLHSSATIGMIETPFFRKGYYYILDAGARYRFNPTLMMGVSGGYNSDFGVMPTWNMGVDGAYQINRNLQFDGRVNYIQTAGNNYGVKQSAVMIDLHSRYRLSDDWYVNAYGGMPVSQKNNKPDLPLLPMLNTPYYGGSMEYWFKPSMGVEAGMIWMRDMFSGKMRPQPKLELLFRPGK